MPLRVPPAPAPALRSVLAALRTSTTGDHNLPRTEPALPVHEIAHVSRQGPPHTRLTGWRFLLSWPGGEGELDTTASAAETRLTADGWTFAHFRGGPYVSSTTRALEQAETLPLPYQPRLLSFPELYMLTLWLHGEADADAFEGSPRAGDLLVPLAPAPPGIAPHQPQRMDTLLPQLTHRLANPGLVRTPA